MTQFLSLTFTGGKHRVLTRHWSPPARSIPRGEGLRTLKVSGLTPLDGAPALSKKVSACSGSGVLGREHGGVKTPVHPEALAVTSPSFPATRLTGPATTVSILSYCVISTHSVHFLGLGSRGGALHMEDKCRGHTCPLSARSGQRPCDPSCAN